jgi:putative ABC transport system permease protein
MRAVANDDAGRSIVGDLDREFAEDAATASRWRAHRRYWRHAWSVWWWSAWTHPRTSHHQPRGDVMFDLIGDVRHALRLAAKTPAQTLLIVSTLALGIGVATIGFAFADTALLRALPMADPTNTAMVFSVEARDPQRASVYLADYFDFRERTRTIEGLSMLMRGRATLVRASRDPLRIVVNRVGGDLFTVWGVRAMVGRTLQAADGTPGAPRVAVLSHRFWRDSFAAASDVVGTSVMVDGDEVAIVGVLTPDVDSGGFSDVDVWLSYPHAAAAARDLTPVLVTGRFAAGVTAASADAEFRVLAQALAEKHPETNGGRTTIVLPARRATGGPNVELVMALLAGSAILVVVIASVNVAGVLLARGVVRQRELALRVALGAGNLRMFRQTAVEGLLLAALGGLGGVAVAEGGLRLIRSVDAEPIIKQILIDWHELAFIAALAMLSPLVFSLGPAVAAVRINVVGALAAGGVRTSGGHSRRAREGLVIGQLALAVALATVGGLVMRTASALAGAPDGFTSTDVVTFALTLDQQAPDSAARRAIVQSVTAELVQRTGAVVGVIDILPAASSEPNVTIHPDAVPPDDPARAPAAHVVHVDQGLFTAFGIAVIEGRGLTASDVERDDPVALVSREAAVRYFGGVRQSLDRRVVAMLHGQPREFRVVGVTGDVRDTVQQRGMPPRLWLPAANVHTPIFALRVSGDRRSAAEAIRDVVRRTAPGVPIERLEAYERAIARRDGGNRIAMGMLIAFSIVALLLSAIGLYGTVALASSMRQSEFATRVAVGAGTGDLLRLVVGHTLRLAALGFLPGMALGVAGAMGIRRLLYGVTPFDPINVLVVLLTLATIAACASAGPALRAVRLDVASLLRRG